MTHIVIGEHCVEEPSDKEEKSDILAHQYPSTRQKVFEEQELRRESILNSQIIY